MEYDVLIVGGGPAGKVKSMMQILMNNRSGCCNQNETASGEEQSRGICVSD